MLTRLGKFFFLLIVLGNLSLNHFLLGYCHHAECIFISQCPCQENQCPCGECPCGEDCSTYLYLDLDELPETLNVLKPLVFEELPLVEFATTQFSPGPTQQADTPINQPTGPPGSVVPLRHLHSIYLI